MIYHGDLFDVLPTLDAESVDACVTDPPYGIGFMGREWDTFNPAKARASKHFAIGNGDHGRKGNPNPNIRSRRQSPAMSPSQIEYDRSLYGQREFQAWTERWAREVLRVLKPGAHAVVCGAPRSYHRMACGLEDAGFVVRDGLSWLYGQGFPKSLNLGDGLGTALKPSWEPCVLAWKPFKGTTTACHATYGTAALNIEACRIETATVDDYGRTANRANGRKSIHRAEGYGHDDTPSEPSDLGRWPANVCLDEEAAAMLDEQSGELASGSNPERRSADKHRTVYQGWKGEQTCLPARGFDAGGASRFYYVAKPSQEERNFGAVNRHPTVKPVELMRWLVKLVVPINGVYVDPFTGSGTTGMACAYEQREFIGIEREAEYVQIAERRIAAVAPLFHPPVSSPTDQQGAAFINLFCDTKAE